MANGNNVLNIWLNESRNTTIQQAVTYEQDVKLQTKMQIKWV